MENSAPLSTPSTPSTPVSAPLNRIERRKLTFRDNITRAAIKLFEEQGIAETSIASIIKEADIAHKTFFNHFPTKDHLLQHIAGSFSHQSHEVFLQGLAKYNDPAKRVEFCLMNIAKTLETVKPHYKGLLNFYLISGAGHSPLQREQKESFTAIIQQIITDAKTGNQLRSGSTAETYTDMVVGICVAILLNWSLEDDFPIVDKMKKAVKFINSSMFV